MDNKKRKRYLRKEELTFYNILARCGLFVILFFCLGIFILLIVSYFLYKTKDPTSYLQLGGMASLFSATLLTGFIQSRVNKCHYFFSSLILGILLFLTTLIIALITPNYRFSIDEFIWRLLIPVFGILGSMLGIKKEGKRKKH